MVDSILGTVSFKFPSVIGLDSLKHSSSMLFSMDMVVLEGSGSIRLGLQLIDNSVLGVVVEEGHVVFKTFLCGQEQPTNVQMDELKWFLCTSKTSSREGQTGMLAFSDRHRMKLRSH